MMKKFYRSGVYKGLLLSVSLSLPVLLQAQRFSSQASQQKELSPVSGTYAITNATVVQAPDRKIDHATVVIKDGLIAAVGKSVPVPSDAIIIKGDSLHVYAGFIDGLSRAGVEKPKEEGNRERPKDPGNPDPEQAGITPHNDVRSFLKPDDKSVEELRALGFAAAQVVPYGNMLPGNGAIVLLTGKSADDMVLVSRSALFSELTGARRMYPATILGVMAKWRELYRQAQQAKNYENVYAENPAGLNRPESNRILQAFYPVIDKRIPVLFEADQYLETQRIITLQSDLGFSAIIGDVKEGWDAIPKIRASGAKVFLSLDLPEDKKDDKKDKKDKKGAKPGDPEKPGASKKEKETVSTLTPAEKEALEKRKAESIALYTGQAASFQKAGLTFGFSSLSAKPSEIRANLRRMIKAGLTEDQALAALTTSPARLLGLSARLGTVENGKIANLVLSDKPYFNEKAKVRYVFVDGILYEQDLKDSPKTDADATFEIGGTWAVTTETPQGKSEESVTFKKDGGNYSGSIRGGRLPEAVPLDAVEITGSTLKYSFTVQMGGQTFKVDVNATVEGNTFKGNATVGQFGSFPVEGKKEPNR